MVSVNFDFYFNSVIVSLLFVLNFLGGMFKVLKLVYLFLWFFLVKLFDIVGVVMLYEIGLLIFGGLWKSIVGFWGS